MRLVSLLSALVGCVVLAGCGGDDETSSGAGGPKLTPVKKDLALDETIDDAKGTAAHLTRARLTTSLAGESPDVEGEVWLVLDMTVTTEVENLSGDGLNADLLGPGLPSRATDIEEKLPNGLEPAELPKGEPSDLAAVYVLEKRDLGQPHSFSLDGNGSVELNFCPPDVQPRCVYEE